MTFIPVFVLQINKTLCQSLNSSHKRHVTLNKIWFCSLIIHGIILYLLFGRGCIYDPDQSRVKRDRVFGPERLFVADVALCTAYITLEKLWHQPTAW